MTDYTIPQILKIHNPCDLFSNDVALAKNEFRTLCMKFHPDVCKEPKAEDAFVHIKKLYDDVEKLLERGKWETSNITYMTSSDGVTYKIGFKRKHTFELGEMYVSPTVVVYALESKHNKFYDNFLRNVKNFKYASDNMKKEFSRYLPTIKKNFKTNDGKYVIVVEKTPDLLLLRDVHEHYITKGFPVEWDKHVAWMQSRLNNLLCFFKFNGIVHNSISLDTIFISPEFHSVAILGGWWYSTNVNEKMIAVPAELYNVVPPKVRGTKLASFVTDGEFVKALGRKLVEKIKIPKPFENWLNFGAGDDAMDDYKTWQDKILKESYGERKFVKLKLTGDDIY